MFLTGCRKKIPEPKLLILLQCFVLTLLSASIEGKSDLDNAKPHLLGKGLYCKDPDTGDYHPVNSTWSSSTFCGNYVCNIRLKKTITESSEDMHTAELESEPKEVTGEESRIEEVIDDSETAPKEVHEGILGLSEKSTNSENVTSIREFLLSIDENELKALFEIYKLAYDMAKEMEQVSQSDNPADEFEKARSATRVMYDKIPLFLRIPSSDGTVPNSISYQHPSNYYYSHAATQRDGDLTSSGSENAPKVVEYKQTNLQGAQASIPEINPGSRVPVYNAAPQKYSRYYLNPATGQVTPFAPTIAQSPSQSTNSYASPNPANNQYSYYYTYPHTHQYPQFTHSQTYPQTFVQPQQPQNQVYYVNPAQNQSPQYNRNYNSNSQTDQSSSNINIPLFRKVPEAQTPCALEQQVFQSQNLIQPNSDIIYEKNILDSMAKQYKRALIDPEQLKALKVPLSKEFPSEKRRNLRDLFGGLSKKSRSRLSKLEAGHVVTKRETGKEGRKNHRSKKEKPTSNEEVETYVAIVKCQFESEPGYFRKGKNTDPYPLCCPQKIDEDEEE